MSVAVAIVIIKVVMVGPTIRWASLYQVSCFLYQGKYQGLLENTMNPRRLT